MKIESFLIYNKSFNYFNEGLMPKEVFMRKHLFHIVQPSPWPILVAISLFFITSGLGFYVHRVNFGGSILIFGLILIVLFTTSWYKDIITEATYLGLHTQVVRSGLKSGFLLFILSEVMLFFGFFWAFFHSALCPSVEFAAIWPPQGIQVILAHQYPLLNTIILLVSGFAVTWVHKGVSSGSMKETIDAFLTTIVLGFTFIILQIYEYNVASFDITDSVYSSTFYMLTGLHGLHVMAGVSFLLICFIRLLRNHFLSNHYLGLVFAIWYWHFVDVIWILLFIVIYCWGNL